MGPLDLINLTAVMERTLGSPEVKIGLIDGPVATHHSDLAGGHFREFGAANGADCAQPGAMACLHGTFVAGILSARRGSPAPAICPGCSLLIRPVFAGTTPGTTPAQLAAAIVECMDAGARVLNLSLALAEPFTKGEHVLDTALNQAAARSVIVVAAAGNQGTLASTVITRHPWVIPVSACDLQGSPISLSNLGASIGSRGLAAPGDAITSLNALGPPLTLSGTSVAVPFVTGTIALLWSEFPNATAAQMRLAVSQGRQSRRAALVPPLLNAAQAYQSLMTTNARRQQQ